MLDIAFRADAAASVLGDRFEQRRPRLALVLGSGLRGVVDDVEDATSVAFSEVPHVRCPTAPGHEGRFVAGTLGGLDVVVVSGRLHGYEGLAVEEVTFPIRILASLGVETVLLTNAAGGVAPTLGAGDLMIVDDHVNLTGVNPLRGPNDDRLGTRFPDMTAVYDAALREALDRAAAAAAVRVAHGVYAGVAGPSYETPAEVRMLRTLGADAVGMSTVHEAIVARHAGLRLGCVSCITNAAAGFAGSPLSHIEVLETAGRTLDALRALILAFCRLRLV